MNYELVAAIIAAIRASPIGTAVGGRIYESSSVPANVAFPRCYITLRTSPDYVRWSKADGGVDRRQLVEISFVSTAPTAFPDIEGWDKAARLLLEYSVTCPNLVSFLRKADAPTSQQSIDLTTFVMGGGVYEAVFQES